ncbi:MAG: PPE domain-containing protein [Pseudonocardiaceae bacterium]
MTMAGSWEIAGDAIGHVVGGVAGGVARGVGAVAGLFDVGEPEGNDYGSSHWPGWEHEEICSMLDTTVEPGDVHEGARAWNDQRLWAADIVKRLTDDLGEIVSNGWHGKSADAAVASLEPVDRWSSSQSEAAEHTGRLLDDSGSAVGQTKATVPPPVHHDLRRSLTSFAVGGVPGAFVDAIAQDHAQEEARREAVRIMNNVYSAPIKDNRAAVPTYPELIDPTLQPPEPSPVVGPTPGTGLSGVGSGLPGGGAGSGDSAPPAAAGLQSTGAGSVDGAQFAPVQPTGPQQTGKGQGYGSPGYPGQGGQGLGTAAVPFMPPMAGVDEQERARREFRGVGSPGARVGGGGGYPGGGRGGVSGYSGGGGDFGPRGSSPGSAGAAGEGRVGAGGAASGRGGGGVPGGVPVGGAGGRGQGGEDTEHQRPSYLIEMDDVFNDGRKVAPPVIGVDLPEDHR